MTANEGKQRGSFLKSLVQLLLPWGLVVLGPFAILGPAVLRGEVLFWGTPLLQFVPWRMFAWESIASGHFPLWNPLVGMGAPLLANHQSALLYPPNWLLPILGVAWGHGLLVMLHWSLAAIGTVYLARRLGMGPVAQTVSGLAYGLSGYLVARAGFFSINAATAWLPWVVLGVERICAAADSVHDRREWFSGVGGLAVPLALQWLSGHAQTAWYTLLFALAWWLMRTVTLRPYRRIVVRAVRMIVGGLLGFLLSAPQLLPTFEYLLHSQRAGSVDPSLAMTYSFWPWRLLELLVPGAFGWPQNGVFWGYANYWEDAIYIGVLPALLVIGAGVAALRGRSDRSRLTGFLFAVSALSLMLALGDNTPVFPWLFEHVPTFDLFQAPTRWSLLLVFSLALLSGIGAEAWGPARGRALYWLRLGTAGAAAVTGAAWVAALLLEQVRPSTIQAFALAGVWLMLAGVLGLWQRSERSPGWMLAVGGVVAVNLVIAGSGLNPTTDASLYQGTSELRTAVDPEHRVYLGADTEYYLTFYESFRFDTFRAREDWRWVRDVGLPNATMLDGLQTADNFDPLVPDRFSTWLEEFERLPHEQQSKWLRLMDVGAYANRLNPQDEPRYRSVESPERIRWVGQAHRVEAGDGQAVMSFLQDPEFDPGKVVILEGSGPGGAAGRRGDIVRMNEIGPGHIQVQYESEQAGWLVLSDTWYPGWRAKLDGRPANLLRANFLFRAVPVPAGAHTVEFVYFPRSFAIGAVLALVGVALLVLGWRKELLS